MMDRSLLLVGLVSLVLALAMTGVLSIVRTGEEVEVFGLPPETLDLPFPVGPTPEAALISPQATVAPALAPTSITAGPLSQTPQPAVALLQSGRDGYAGCSDTFIQLYRPADNFCQSPELYVVTDNRAATLLRFDLTKLPENVVGLNSGATIVEATLELYLVQGNRGAVAGIYLPYGPWDPCTITWNTPWAKPGADGPSDREHDPRVEGTTEQETGWMAFDATGLVQLWLSEPSQNYGVIIKSFDVNVPSQYVFLSSDHSSADQRPRLTIKYEPASPAASATGQTPTAGPPIAATPTPVLPLSARVIELHWRSEMDVAGSYAIQVIFRPETARSVSSSTQSYVLSVYGQLTAPTFDVVQDSPTEQVLEQPEGTLTWSWHVQPRILGSQLLSLDLLFGWRPATSAAPAVTTDTGTWYQTKVVKVVRPFRYWTPIALLRNLLLSVGLVCLVGWYLLTRQTSRRAAGD